MTRRELEERVDELAAQHEGQDLVKAVEKLADELSAPERELLAEVLLERGRDHAAEHYAEQTERMRAARWRVLFPPRRHPPK